MQRVFVRGLNFHGQLGIGPKVRYTRNTFIENHSPVLKEITKLETNTGHNLALLNKKSVLYWGYTWDIRSFYRSMMANQSIPFVMRLAKKVWPPLRSFPHQPSLLKEFEHEIKQIEIGGASAFFLDSQGVLYSVGENSWGQLGHSDLETLYNVTKISLPRDDLKFVEISAGFQHSLFLTENGELYGCGKSDKLQLGKRIMLESYKDSILGEKALGLQQIDCSEIEGKIIKIKGGKFHSVVLTDTGAVYAFGQNRFGQLGISNLTTFMSSKLLKIEFPFGEKVVDIQVGDNHNLFITEDGQLFGNGDNGVGQLDGDLNYFLKEFSSVKPILLPNKTKIVKLQAKSNRSCAFMEDGEVLYWGGFSYDPYSSYHTFPRYSGINSYNKEETLPKNCKINMVGLGYLHDIVVLEA